MLNKAPAAPNAVEFADLTLGYGSHPAVHHLSGGVRRGSLTAIVGSNGSGKSTLLKGLVGILKPMSGAISMAAGQRLAYLPQQSELDRSFPARVLDLVALGLWSRRGLFGRHSKDDKARLMTALSAVGLEGFEDRAIDTLSGGQLQRALFARVLVQDADFILLDEPFNAIDAKTVADLIALIGRWHGESRTVMVVVHDLELVRQHFPDALLLARAPVAWGKTGDVLHPENLLKARNFREPWDDSAPWCGGPNAGHDHDHDHDHIHDHQHHRQRDHGHHHGHAAHHHAQEDVSAPPHQVQA
ncbi:MAG: metal ABC transporter ATP-binding protein [Rhizobiaceae bacterium]|jgi:zinc/manganese transport system ATP-binding protein|nr:metal ABC transporter ATP-binding protein [Rhizobiaceae bacterium]